jgi:hypothetical protein
VFVNHDKIPSKCGARLVSIPAGDKFIFWPKTPLFKYRQNLSKDHFACMILKILLVINKVAENNLFNTSALKYVVYYYTSFVRRYIMHGRV